MNRVVFFLLACLATPAMADEAHLNGMAEEVLASEWADPTYLGDDYLFEPIGFDHPSVQTSFLLDAHPFAALEPIFGGTPQVEEIFDNLPVRWLCYDTGNARTTFASIRSDEAGNETFEPGPVIGVIIEEAHAPDNAACSQNPAAAAPQPSNDIPGLGAKVSDLKARFGSAPIDAGGHVAYVSKAELGDSESWIETKTIYYRIEDGIVTGVAYKMTNADVVMSPFMYDAITGQYASSGTPEQRETPRVGLIQTGAIDLQLEETSMDDVAEIYGGKVHERGEAGAHVMWLCYFLPDGTAWFYSDGETGHGNVTGIAVQADFPDETWGCAMAPFTLRYFRVDMPGTRITEAELEATFGPATPDAEGRVGFSSQAPHPTKDGVSIQQDYVYRFGASGKVDAVAVLQMSGD